MTTTAQHRAVPQAPVGIAITILGLTLTVVMTLATRSAFAGDLAANTLLAQEPGELALADRLGPPICTSKDAAKATSRSYYQSSDGAILMIALDDAPWAVDYGRVVEISVDRSAGLPNSCANPTHAGLPRGSFSLANSEMQLQLGDSIDRAREVMGEPHSIDSQASGVRLRYIRERDETHVEQWTLTLYNGRLQGWRVRSLPVFFEVAG